jgi:ribonuclease HII
MAAELFLFPFYGSGAAPLCLHETAQGAHMDQHSALMAFTGDPAVGPEQVAGVDEAGRGCLAGPVVAGAVILPPEWDLSGLNDSKKLTAAKREILYEGIRQQAVAWAVGLAWPAEVDSINILQATFLAMSRAVSHLGHAPRQLLVDGNKTIPEHAFRHTGGQSIAQRAIVGGDGLVPAISAASIMAKTFRDRLMTRLDRRYPGYGFCEHMGYGTKAHYAALELLGPCRMHRLTFRGVVQEKQQPQQSQGLLPGM